MKSSEQVPPTPESPPPRKGRGEGVLTPLTPEQTKIIVKNMAAKGATFFDWDKFQRLTWDLPPNTSLADALKALRSK